MWCFLLGLEEIQQHWLFSYIADNFEKDLYMSIMKTQAKMLFPTEKSKYVLLLKTHIIGTITNGIFFLNK